VHAEILDLAERDGLVAVVVVAAAGGRRRVALRVGAEGAELYVVVCCLGVVGEASDKRRSRGNTRGPRGGRDESEGETENVTLRRRA
jgi:hypothetical protein